MTVSDHSLVARAWKRPLGPGLLRVEIIVPKPSWRPDWIWHKLDALTPLLSTWDGDATSPLGMLITLRSLEASKLRSIIGYAGAVTLLVDHLVDFVLPRPVVVPAWRAFGIRWLGVSIYATRR